mmetsp:Transcript_46496/g.148417  ORF Transcript_46496/g.148417 Transcript_46496/m.148417 type:complete len:217 (-) Transcript_46496:356-1006(-)
MPAYAPATPNCWRPSRSPALRRWRACRPRATLSRTAPPSPWRSSRPGKARAALRLARPCWSSAQAAMSAAPSGVGAQPWCPGSALPTALWPGSPRGPGHLRGRLGPARCGTRTRLRPSSWLCTAPRLHCRRVHRSGSTATCARVRWRPLARSAGSSNLRGPWKSGARRASSSRAAAGVRPVRPWRPGYARRRWTSEPVRVAGPLSRDCSPVGSWTS